MKTKEGSVEDAVDCSLLLPRLFDTSGQLTVGLVREFLEFFELDFTCSVFDPESSAVSVYVCAALKCRDVHL